MTGKLSRRRFLTIAAATAVTPVCVTAPAAPHTRWQGTALGADAQMVFSGADGAAAQAAVDACLTELERLELIFSLYDKRSELSRLNRDGALARPSNDLLSLMRTATWFSAQTNGAFDCTVQPLWRHMADYFRDDPARRPPRPGELASVLEHVDYRSVRLSPEAITLPAGGAITLNGIAQGYITDRIAELLRDMGWRNVLVDMGEIRALPDRSWPVRVAETGRRLSLTDKAVATSSGAATPFSTDGRSHHLLDPRTGMCPDQFKAVSVVAPLAVTADALSTALAVARPAEIPIIAGRFPEVRIYA